MSRILTARQEQNFFDKISMIPGGCHEWLGLVSGNGYGRFNINGKTHYAHRVAWALEHGRWPDDQVNHHCDNKSCTKPEHLYDGTTSQNMIDAIQRNKTHKKVKLTQNDVHMIRELIGIGASSLADIGRLYNVSHQAISSIKYGKTWSHI